MYALVPNAPGGLKGAVAPRAHLAMVWQLALVRHSSAGQQAPRETQGLAPDVTLKVFSDLTHHKGHPLAKMLSQEYV